MALDLKAQMTEDLKRVQEKLATARVKHLTATVKMEDLERQEEALHSALGILGGVRPRPAIIVKPGKMEAAYQYAPPPLEMVTLNGEPVVLEPGYKIGRNSFGEECIVPMDAADYPTMAEPTKPIPTTHGVVLPATTESLDRPEDML